MSNKLNMTNHRTVVNNFLEDTSTSHAMEYEKLMHEYIKRCNYYHMSDYSCIGDILHHMGEKQKTKIKTVFPNQQWKEYIGQWAKAMSYYLENKEFGDIPPSWSASQVIPMCIIVNDGDAGTGKTFSMSTLVQSIPDAAVCSSYNKASDSFLEYLEKHNLPGGYEHIKENNTIYKMFKIRFSSEKVKHILEMISQDSELEESYKTLIDYSNIPYEGKHVENITRKHFRIAAKVLWPLVAQSFHEMIDDFMTRNKGIKYQRTILDKSHEHYQGPENMLKPISRFHIEQEKAASSSTNERLRHETTVRCQSMSRIHTQNAYRMMALFKYNGYVQNLPPIPALCPTILFEEDGRMPPFMHDFRIIMIMLIHLMYNTPYIYDNVPTIIVSGSQVQSNAIKSFASALNIASSLLYLGDTENTLAYKSEFFRRSILSFQCSDNLATRATIMSLERGIQPGPFTYLSMLTREEHSVLAADPAYRPGAKRLYHKHVTCEQYTKRMASQGKMDIHITDAIFVSDLLVIPEWKDIKNVTDQELSTLSETEARKNRMFMWEQKRDLYKNDNIYRNDTTIYVTKGKNSRSTLLDECSQQYSESAVEHMISSQMINDMLHDVQTNVKKRKDSSSSHIMDTELGTVLPGDGIFTHEIQDLIQYERHIQGLRVTEGVSRHKKVRREELKESHDHRVDDCGDDEHSHADSDSNRDTEEDEHDDETNDSNTKRKMRNTVQFIMGRARDMLSRTEHISRRMYIESICSQLNYDKGLRLSKSYYRGSRVADQTGTFSYDPQNDLVIELACPDYNYSYGDEEFDCSVSRTLNARIMFMCLKRSREMSRLCDVSNESVNTHIIFRGIQSSLKELMKCSLFFQHTSDAFKCMIYECILRQFAIWCCNHFNESGTPVITSTNISELDVHYEKLKFTYSANTNLKSICEIIDEYKMITKSYTNRSKLCVFCQKECGEIIHLSKLKEVFGRLINNILKGPWLDFVDMVLTISAEQSIYSTYFIHSKTISLDSLHVSLPGDLQILNTGFSDMIGESRKRKEGIIKEIQRVGLNKFFLDREEFMRQKPCGLKLNVALGWAIEFLCNDLYLNVMSTILCANVLVATTVPFTTFNVPWSSIFDTNKTFGPDHTVGFMMRRGLPSLYTASSKLVNDFFSYRGGEMVNLPRPFKVYESPSNINTNVVVKTGDKIHPYSRRQTTLQSYELLTTSKAHISLDTISRWDVQARKVKLIEILGVMTFMNPMFFSPATTVMFSQGSTISGPVVLDFNQILQTEHLIGLTRSNNVKNLYVSGVLETVFKKDDNSRKILRKQQRVRSNLSQRYFKYK